MEIGNLPGENQKTGRITPLSVIALLRKMTAPLRVGT
jgi:aspartate dehydrogenase